MAPQGRSRRRSVPEYSSELPEGVGLRWAAQFGRFQLYRKAGGAVLAERRESEVLRWKRPSRVFAYIARRVARGVV